MAPPGRRGNGRFSARGRHPGLTLDMSSTRKMTCHSIAALYGNSATPAPGSAPAPRPWTQTTMGVPARAARTGPRRAPAAILGAALRSMGGRTLPQGRGALCVQGRGTARRLASPLTTRRPRAAASLSPIHDDGSAPHAAGLALEHGPDTPHIIVARDGCSVTCLGKGVSVGDHVVSKRPRKARWRSPPPRGSVTPWT
jgi:hypothetical protein